MMTKAEKLKALMFAVPPSDVRRIFAEWDTITTERTNDVRAAVLADGFEEIDTPVNDAALPDGREVLRVGGRAYVLPADVHRARLAEAMQAAKKQREEQTKHSPGEGLSAVLCPSCKSVMAKSPVCPNCAKGKVGFKILCICTECAHEVYL
jgi:hypothetical protein